MAKNGLDKWFKQKWVDIGSKRKDGSFAKCGRSKQKKDAKRKYPKCVPLAKATRMSDSQRASAVKRKRAAGNTGPTPTNVATFTKRSKAAEGGYMGSFIRLNVDGRTIGNPSLKKGGFVARGCGAIMSGRSKKTKMM